MDTVNPANLQVSDLVQLTVQAANHAKRSLRMLLATIKDGPGPLPAALLETCGDGRVHSPNPPLMIQTSNPTGALQAIRDALSQVRAGNALLPEYVVDLHVDEHSWELMGLDLQSLVDALEADMGAALVIRIPAGRLPEISHGAVGSLVKRAEPFQRSWLALYFITPADYAPNSTVATSCERYYLP